MQISAMPVAAAHTLSGMNTIKTRSTENMTQQKRSTKPMSDESILSSRARKSWTARNCGILWKKNCTTTSRQRISQKELKSTRNICLPYQKTVSTGTSKASTAGGLNITGANEKSSDGIGAGGQKKSWWAE